MFARLLTAARTLRLGFLQLLYPNVCWACGQSLDLDAKLFCPSCRQALATDPHPTCPRCAGTVGPFAHLVGGCTACRGTPLVFERAGRLGPYKGKLKEVVLRLKRSSEEGLAEVMGDLWAEQREVPLRQMGAHLVIPVPLHWRRRLHRGYNQSEVLARRLAARLGLPCCPGWLWRIRNTPPQKAQQSPTDRRKNLLGAFRASARAALNGKTILLVDDMLTTGFTVNEAARALVSAGAARVVVAVLARWESG